MAYKSYEFKRVKPKDLIPFKENPRKHNDKMIDKLEKSMEKFGFIAPIIALESTKEILAGHARHKTAIQRKEKEVPVVFIDMEREEAIAYIIADNKIQEDSEWDFPLLKDLMADLDTGAFDMEVTGFSDGEIANMFNMLSIDDKEEESEKEMFVEDFRAPDSNIKMVQIYLTTETHPEFMEKVNRLSISYKTDNLTDTLSKALDEALTISTETE